MEKLLEVSDLHVAFPSKRETVRAVDGVSFQVFQGETFGLVGESGCGKSQTLRSILGLLKQPGRITGGAIRYKGADIAKMSQRELQKIRGKEISMIFQEPMTSLDPAMKIGRQVEDALRVHTKLARAVRRERALEAMALAGLPEPEKLYGCYPHQLSGGMRQRVGIARALANDPDVLLMDEPYGQLDIELRFRLEDELVKLWQLTKTTVLFITHNIEEAVYLGNKIMILTNKPTTVKTTLINELPRPRDIADPQFIELRNKVTELIKWW